MAAKGSVRTYGIEPLNVVTRKKRALAKVDVPNRHASGLRSVVLSAPVSG